MCWGKGVVRLCEVDVVPLSPLQRSPYALFPAHSSHHLVDLLPHHTIAMAQRVTLRKRQPYNTSSSRRRIVKTPGGVLRYHHIKKLPTAPKCGDCGSKLSGVRVPFPKLLLCSVLIPRHRLLPCARASTQLYQRRKNT